MSSHCSWLLTPPTAPELGWLRHLEHRVQVDRGIIFGGGRRGRCRDGSQIKPAAGNGRRLGRIDQPIAAYPDTVAGGWERRDEIAALVIGHNDLSKLGGQV